MEGGRCSAKTLCGVNGQCFCEKEINADNVQVIKIKSEQEPFETATISDDGETVTINNVHYSGDENSFNEGETATIIDFQFNGDENSFNDDETMTITDFQFNGDESSLDDMLVKETTAKVEYALANGVSHMKASSSPLYHTRDSVDSDHPVAGPESLGTLAYSVSLTGHDVDGDHQVADPSALGTLAHSVSLTGADEDGGLSEGGPDDLGLMEQWYSVGDDERCHGNCEATPYMGRTDGSLLHEFSGKDFQTSVVVKSEDQTKTAAGPSTPTKVGPVRVNAGRQVTPTKPSHCEPSGSTPSRVAPESDSSEEVFTCKVCFKAFPSSEELEQHMTTMFHWGEKPFECTVCGKRLAHAASLKSHMFLHTGEQPFPCQLCTKKFVASSHLKAHMKIHERTKSYTCEVCHKSFTHSWNLKSHMNTHTGQKAYGCTVCGKKFVNSSLVRRHMLLHTGEKPHVCHICQKAFNVEWALRKHVARHTGDYPHQCPLCPKSFFLPYGLKKHMQTHTSVRKSKGGSRRRASEQKQRHLPEGL